MGEEFEELPPGYKFMPTDVEALKGYLLPKFQGHYISQKIIPEFDIYLCEPQELPEESHRLEGPLVANDFVGQDFVRQYLMGEDFAGQEFMQQDLMGQNFMLQDLMGQDFIEQDVVPQQTMEKCHLWKS
ncbi:hypothetical protein Vadar_013259 [Vaccinium darrowii]|nr:hypothetical protein Vadar_013259 [Vaccinium darrowii]